MKGQGLGKKTFQQWTKPWLVNCWCTANLILKSDNIILTQSVVVNRTEPEQLNCIPQAVLSPLSGSKCKKGVITLDGFSPNGVDVILFP